MPDFIPGLELADAFYREAVRPVLDTHYPGIVHAAALIGYGSEVLGFDTEMSTDHHWGPRVMLFLRPEDFESRRHDIHRRLSEALPHSFRGYPTNFDEPGPEDPGTRLLRQTTSGPINHRVEMFAIGGFFREYLNIDIDAELRPADWLTIPFQPLRSIVAGRVFHDEVGLDDARARFAWYPHDIWLYLLASGWSHIGEEEHLMGRAGIVGDEIGSSLIASRIVRDIMRLAFLMEHQYSPYAKWFGTAFAELACAASLQPPLRDVLHATSWQQRETHLCEAYSQLAQMHNELNITPPRPTEPAPFWGRPFRVIKGEGFADAIKQAIRDPQIKRLAEKRLIGNIDMLDSTDLLEDTSRRQALSALFE